MKYIFTYLFIYITYYLLTNQGIASSYLEGVYLLAVRITIKYEYAYAQWNC